MNSSKTIPLLFLLIIAFSCLSQSNALLAAPYFNSLYQFGQPNTEDGNLDNFWSIQYPSTDEQLYDMSSPEKRNFYTHFWRSIAQRMPSYRGGNGRISSLAERSAKVDVDKRTPWIDRMDAIRTG
ncbi:hypothetical protein niasHT_002942 [Heterodera trifolii]|uniref:Uncharacterized protein n=1 Tax=Heterodera trifolii TaxID=157864 RepID=A0ABD2LPF7_9BILA